MDLPRAAGVLPLQDPVRPASLPSGAIAGLVGVPDLMHRHTRQRKGREKKGRENKRLARKGQASKDLESKGLESKGLESKGPESMGPERKGLESRVEVRGRSRARATPRAPSPGEASRE